MEGKRSSSKEDFDGGVGGQDGNVHLLSQAPDPVSMTKPY